MKDFRDIKGVKKHKINRLVGYLEKEDVKERYKETLDYFNVLEQEIYPVEIVSRDKLDRKFKKVRDYWDINGVGFSYGYTKINGLSKEYIMKIRLFYK